MWGLSHFMNQYYMLDPLDIANKCGKNAKGGQALTWVKVYMPSYMGNVKESQNFC